MKERINGGQPFPSPRPGETMLETPPVFLWVGNESIKNYRIEVYNHTTHTLFWAAETSRNVLRPDVLFPPGIYRWNIYADETGQITQNSNPSKNLNINPNADLIQNPISNPNLIRYKERGWEKFVVSGNAVPFLPPKSEKVFKGIPPARPRHLFYKEDIMRLREIYAPELETLKRNVALAMKKPLPRLPDFHINNDFMEYRNYFGKHRDCCDRDMVALSLASVLLEDEKAGQKARELFLTLCSWNPDGPCSPDGEWGDEIGLSHARCFPAVLDLLWPRLSVQERNFTARTVANYAFRCEERLRRLDFNKNPGDSHCGRIPAYLGEAALALKDAGTVPDDILHRWLECALDIYSGIFPHFGGSDGGWAEGTFYAASYTKWYLPFFSSIARYSGINFLDRPFYQNLIHFFIHFAPPGRENHPFCDGYWCLPDDEEWPGFFAQNPFRVYANRSPMETGKRFCEQLRSPEIFKLHLLDIFLPPMKTPEICLTGTIENVRSFPDAGFVSLHTDIKNPENDTALLARASRYGPVSHQHADQGNFAIIHKGKTLITPSGYFGGAFGTRHHREWTRTTFAHNCILIDGKPQPMDYTSTGSIINCGQKAGKMYAELDLAAAYPKLISYRRSFTLIKNTECIVITVRDKIKANKPVTVNFLNHTLTMPYILSNGALAVSRGYMLTIKVKSGLFNVPEIKNHFPVGINEGSPKKYWVDKPEQYHIRWDSEPKPEHDIIVHYTVKN